jgi:hypothetical protein
MQSDRLLWSCVMFRKLWRDYGPLMFLVSLALFAFGGWAGLVYSAVSSNSEIAQLRGERDSAVRDYALLSKSAGELNEITGKVARAKAELDRTAQAWAEARQKLAAVQQDLTTPQKRPDPLADLISQTGTVPRQQPKPLARKVAN